MASTADQVIARFRREFYPDCPAATAAALWQDAWHRGVAVFRLRENAVTVLLTAGTREYALDAAIAAVREAWYEPSADATEWHPLSGVALDTLVQNEAGWRSGDLGMPSRYYVRADADGDGGRRVIGFDPIPDTTSSGGYPRVRLHTVQRTDLTGSETLPAFLPSDEWFLYEMAFRWAIRQDRGAVEGWGRQRDAEQADWSALVKSAVDDVPTLIIRSPFAQRGARAI